MIDGHFIVLEGVDGAGTTTHTKLLKKYLESKGLPVHATREPSDGPIGVLLRQMLTGRVVVPGMHGPRAPSWITMSLLFAADRADHVESEIDPNLRDGVTVLSDRYYHSSVAYQSATSDHVDVTTWVRELNRHARAPDLTLVLDLPPEIAARRRAERGGGKELYDDLELQRRLTDFYATMERYFPGERIVHIDSDGSIEHVAARIVREVERLRSGG